MSGSPRPSILTLAVGDLVELAATRAAPGFVLRDTSNRVHYFYYTSDKRFAKYDGWSEAVHE